MDKKLKYPFWGKNTLVYLTLIGILVGFIPIFEPRGEAVADFLAVDFSGAENLSNLVIIEGNSLAPIAHLFTPKSQSVRRIKVVVTAYSSTSWETDGDPYITAAGTWVRDGIVANNYLPLGTKIRMPEIFGEKVFVVEDRMSWKKGNYQVDIWFPNYWEALNFGAKRTYIEILEG